MKARALALAILLIAALLPAAAAADTPAGRVKNADGEAFITRGDQRAAARPGDPVHQGDILETGADGSLGITFRDESRLGLGPSSQLVVDEYVYNPEAEGSFLTRLVRGSVLAVSGLIAKLSPGGAQMETPDGTIGIRGTRFLVRLAPREPA